MRSRSGAQVTPMVYSDCRPCAAVKSTSTNTQYTQARFASAMHQLLGVDVTGMPGMDIRIRCCVLSVKPGQHCQSQRFPAWQTLRHELCPGTKISGGKIQSSKTARVANKAARAFRLAAQAAGRIETAIGAFYRRIKSRAGVPSAQASVGF